MPDGLPSFGASANLLSSILEKYLRWFQWEIASSECSCSFSLPSAIRSRDFHLSHLRVEVVNLVQLNEVPGRTTAAFYLLRTTGLWRCSKGGGGGKGNHESRV